MVLYISNRIETAGNLDFYGGGDAAFIFSLPRIREQNQKIRPISNGFFMFDGLKIKRAKTQGFRPFYGGRSRDRICDPYRVNGVMCLFIKHYFCLLIVDKWLVSAKNLYNLFLRSKTRFYRFTANKVSYLLAEKTTIGVK